MPQRPDLPPSADVKLTHAAEAFLEHCRKHAAATPREGPRALHIARRRA
jgi:hypothetical protein